MKFAIELFNLTKKFTTVNVVDNLNLKIEQGEVFGLLGPNGAGKTTTLMMLTTLIQPTDGTALVNGYDIKKEAGKVRKSIGIVFQDPSSDDILTGYENLKLHAMLYDIPDSIVESKISEVLKLVDLEDRKKDLVKNYSGGMRRRLEIARGLMHQPTVLFLDEPTLGLDPQAREHVWEYIRRLASEKKMTIVLTTHYMEEADLLCNRIAIIDKGKVVALDTPGNLKKIIGGDIIRIKSPNPNVEAVKKLDFVKKVEMVDGTVSITVEGARRHLMAILEAIGKVDSVYVREPTLNDVFLHYTGGEITDSGAEGGWAQRMMNAQTRGR
jgi:ABC-2 type transport system ATP-binding protein